MRTNITIIFSSLRGFKKNPSLLGTGTPTAAAGGHPSLASGYCGHHRPIRLQSCVYIHTALVREDAALRLAMPLSCYYHKTQNGFCLSYYMTSCTLLEEPMHPAKQQSIGRAVGPSGEHNIMPLPSVSKWLFFVTLK